MAKRKVSGWVVLWTAILSLLIDGLALLVLTRVLRDGGAGWAPDLNYWQVIGGACAFRLLRSPSVVRP